jgi:hypothetical protein
MMMHIQALYSISDLQMHVTSNKKEQLAVSHDSTAINRMGVSRHITNPEMPLSMTCITQQYVVLL